MIRKTIPTSTTVALTVLGTVLGMKISAITDINRCRPSLTPPAAVQNADSGAPHTIAVTDDAGAAHAAVQTAPPQAGALTSEYYPVTLIGEDGKRTSLAGKDLQIDLGGERLLEIHLARQRKGFLAMWSPLKRGDKEASLLVFHPHCANSFALELERVKLSPDTDNAIRYQTTD